MDFEQFGYIFTCWIFTLCLAFIVWIPVEGQSKVIGSTEPIVASPGDDVILPCHLDPELDVQSLTVEWSNPDLKPDPSDRLRRVPYVHLHRDRHEVLDMKIPAYVGRTRLFADELTRGNISLKITNVTLADQGRYRCFIPKLKSRVKSAIVQLVVEPYQTENTWTTETPLDPTNLQTPEPKDELPKGDCLKRSALISILVFLSVLLAFGVAVCAYLLQPRCRKPNHPNYDIVTKKPLPV